MEILGGCMPDERREADPKVDQHFRTQCEYNAAGNDDTSGALG
jgi:hypothetical protein